MPCTDLQARDEFCLGGIAALNPGTAAYLEDMPPETGVRTVRDGAATHLSIEAAEAVFVLHAVPLSYHADVQMTRVS